jgi:hypothetical protein
VLVTAILAFAAPAAARAQQVTVFSDDFQATTGLNTTKWPTVNGNYSGSSSATGYRNGTYNGQPNGYGTFFPSYSLYFRSNGNRNARTQTLNLSARGAVLTFDLRYQSSGVGTNLPFDEFNTTGEEIIVEYTTNPGAGSPTWTQLQRFAYNSTTYNSWNTATIYLPSAAWTSTVSIRFRQVGHSGASYDNWAIDNVVVVVNPEPGTWALFGAGALGLAAVAARRRRRARLTAREPPAP